MMLWLMTKIRHSKRIMWLEIRKTLFFFFIFLLIYWLNDSVYVTPVQITLIDEVGRNVVVFFNYRSIIRESLSCNLTRETHGIVQNH